MTRTIFIILCVLAYIETYATQPIEKMRFHCESDTTYINQLLAEINCNNLSPRKALPYVAEKLCGTTYVAGTLEGEEELLTINLHQFDCVTFVETAIALAQTGTNANPSWRDFAENLEYIRYRKGEMKGYSSRLHYISEWIADNIYRGNIREITTDFQGTATMEKSLDFMSRNADKYPALADSTNLAEIKKMEEGYRLHRIPYLKKETVSKRYVTESLMNGDIIVFLTKEDGLDASHIGLLKIIEEKPHLLHASSKAGNVVLEEITLQEYFKRYARKAPGVRILRLRE